MSSRQASFTLLPLVFLLSAFITGNCNHDSHSHSHSHSAKYGCGADRISHRHFINKHVYPEQRPLAQQPPPPPREREPEEQSSLLSSVFDTNPNANAEPESDQPPPPQRPSNLLRAQNPASNSVPFENMRITVDTTQLVTDWTSVDAALLSTFLTDIIPPAVEWLQKAFKVRPVNGALTFERMCEVSEVGSGACVSLFTDWQECGDFVTIPVAMFDAKTVGGDSATHTQGAGLSATDLVVYFSGQGHGTPACLNIGGFASYCHSNAYDRPIAAYVNLCQDTINALTHTFEERVILVVHETMHGLGFGSSAFAYYRLNDTNRSPRTARNADGFPETGGVVGKAATNTIVEGTIRGGKPVSFVVLPTVLQMMTAFYGCADTVVGTAALPGLELEEYGGAASASSHWDARVVRKDVMLAQSGMAYAYSILTFALFADTGWYEMDWSYAQQLPDAKDAGCAWFTDPCIDASDASVLDSGANIFCSAQTTVACDVARVSGAGCRMATGYSLPTWAQYFPSSTTMGGLRPSADYCPTFETYSNMDCRHNGLPGNAYETPYDIASKGGVFRGDAKCYEIESPLSTVGAQSYCYATRCLFDFGGSASANVIGVRLGVFEDSTDAATASTWLTCLSASDGGAQQKLPYFYTTEKFKMVCPSAAEIADMCGNEYAYACSGHGTIVNSATGACVCSPGYFGADCSLQQTAANTAAYSASYEGNPCVFDHAVDDNYVYGLNFTLASVTASDGYVGNENAFANAVRNWMAILISIDFCDTYVLSTNYSAIDEEVFYEGYYYKHPDNEGDGYSQLTDSAKADTFGDLFPGTSFEFFDAGDETDDMGHREGSLLSCTLLLLLCTGFALFW